MEKTPVRQSLLRRIAWLGADRRLVGMTGMLCAALGWTMFMGLGLFYGLSIALPCAIFFGSLWAFRRMYKADPWMADVLLRHFRYAKYYPPRSSRRKQLPPIRDYTK